MGYSYQKISKTPPTILITSSRRRRFAVPTVLQPPAHVRNLAVKLQSPASPLKATEIKRYARSVSHPTTMPKGYARSASAKLAAKANKMAVNARSRVVIVIS